VKVVAVAVTRVNLLTTKDFNTDISSVHDKTSKKLNYHSMFLTDEALTASSQCWSAIFCALSSLDSPFPT
jgi:hypothetical protein